MELKVNHNILKMRLVSLSSFLVFGATLKYLKRSFGVEVIFAYDMVFFEELEHALLSLSSIEEKNPPWRSFEDEIP